VTSARDEILSRVRAALRPHGSPPPSTSPPQVTTGVPTPPDDLQGAFIHMLEKSNATVDVVPDETAARDALVKVLNDSQQVAVSDDPMARRLSSSLDSIAIQQDLTDREALLSCDAGVSGAQAGIAETGTLLLQSSAESHRLVSLIPPLHVAILSATRILWSLDDALATLGHEEPSAMSRAVTMVTGPSRTADIELSLVIGVHGPKKLHVILLP